MAKIEIDRNHYEIEEGKNLLEVCLSLGFDLPYFCWHPAMGSVGACRQCAVKQFRDEKDSRGKLVMSCMTPASDGKRISIEDAEAKAFRKSVIEWLMVNHPHDCPVCDEGGECHLQDMTWMTGHAYRRYRFKKRTYRNQYLGPFVNHEMNRCIACYRCVRFYRDYAGGGDLNAFAAHDRVYFGRHEDGVLENEFSGNLVEVCPTGVFTDKTLKKHYTRKWDLQTAPSVCAHCGVGCNTIPGERYGILRRIHNRYHHEINGYFICDRGRYGYEFVNSDRRIRDVWFRPDRRASSEKIAASDAIARIGALLADRDRRARTIGIGSPRASLEANFALRALVGPERFHTGMSEADSRLVARAIGILREGPVASASLRDVERSDAVFVLGEDVAQTAPRLALSIRQAIRNPAMNIPRELKIPDWQDSAVREAIQGEKGVLYAAASCRTRLDEIATGTYHAPPDDLARLGFAVAHALAEEAPDAPGLREETAVLARSIAQALGRAKKPVVVAGIGCGSEAVLEAAANVAWALHRRGLDARICLAAPEANSFGIGLMGGRRLGEAFEAMESGAIDDVIILENDLFRRAPSNAVSSFLAKAKRVILIEHSATAMVPRADVVFPAATFAESDGTLVNHETRAQRFFQVFGPERLPESPPTRESWRWIRDLMLAARLTEAMSWSRFDDLVRALAASSPVFGPVTKVAPDSDFRVAGEKIARQPHRYSGRTATLANVTVHEPEPPEDPDSPLSFSMEGYQGDPPAPLIPRFWAPGWNSVQSLNKFQSEVGGPLRDGPAGLRLIEPAPTDQRMYFGEAPPAFTPREDRWLAVPIHHIFGSDELSLLAAGIAELAPRPYVAIGSQDAARLKLGGGEVIEVRSGGGDPRRLPVRIETGLPRGTIGIPVGLPGMEGLDVDLPAWCEISKQRMAGAA